MKNITDVITPEIISAGLHYPAYRELIDRLLAEGKVTGVRQDQLRFDFTKINIQRMNRIDKTLSVIPSLLEKGKNISRKQNWILLSQGWCGDCAQLVPVIAKIAAVTDKIDLRIINPDDYPQVMDTVLTNGARAVPKLIVLDAETNECLTVWGPRPEPAQQIMLDWKNSENKISWEDFETQLHSWYAKDKSLTTQAEFETLPVWI